MFSQKKNKNENGIKKDFFAIKKEDLSINLFRTEISVNNILEIETDDFTKIKLPEYNDLIIVKSTKNRSLFDFLINKECNKIYVFCSRINKKNINFIKEKDLKGVIIPEKIKDFFNDDLIFFEPLLKIKKNHTKILFFEFENKKYVISGSGNPSINARIENYIIEQNEENYLALKTFYENA